MDCDNILKYRVTPSTFLGGDISRLFLIINGKINTTIPYSFHCYGYLPVLYCTVCLVFVVDTSWLRSDCQALTFL